VSLPRHLHAEIPILDHNGAPATPVRQQHLARSTHLVFTLVLLMALVSAGAAASASPARASAVSTASSSLIGGTPRGSSNAAGVAAMDATYGYAKVVRLFWSGSGGSSPASNRAVVGSLKVVDSSTAPWARTMWRWAYQHEVDSKIKKGLITLAQWKAKMASLVALNVPGLSVILTADAFVNSAKNPSDYLVPGVTHLGVDFDGISSATGYHNYAKELAAVQAFTTAHHLTWGVAEFGANRAGNDPSGSVRATWLKTWTARFTAAGAEYVCLWENSSQAGSTFTTTSENAAVRQLFIPLAAPAAVSGPYDVSVKQGSQYRGGVASLGGVVFKVAVNVSGGPAGGADTVRGTTTITKGTKVARVQIDRIALGTSSATVLVNTSPVNSGTGQSASSATIWHAVLPSPCTSYRARVTYSIRWTDGALSHSSAVTGMAPVC
jgi:hypothetical protein